ncbi:MAG TPA: lactate utilization protein C [Terracidiphilus sp.]|nr:lactate utilization protein C [Terracidiphilus sp.]
MTPADSRSLILDRISHATQRPGGNTYEHLPRAYTHKGALEPGDCVHLLIERLREYDAVVDTCTVAELPACIAKILQANSKHILVVPPGLDPAWLAAGYDWKIDQDLSHAAIEACDGVVTTAFAAIADSGTIVLHHSAAEGRRALSLLPDWHLCILRASQVVETLPEYFARCTQPPRLATYISGPSATADIEMTRIKGVHGPRFLHVLLVRD